MGTHELRSDEDIEEILKMALEEVPAGEEGDMRARLMACAADLDLTAEQVAAAEKRWVKREKERALLAEYKDWQFRRFWRMSALCSFVGIVTPLMGGQSSERASVFGVVVLVAAVVAVSLALNAWLILWPWQTRAKAQFAKWKLSRYEREPR